MVVSVAKNVALAANTPQTPITPANPLDLVIITNQQNVALDVDAGGSGFVTLGASIVLTPKLDRWPDIDRLRPISVRATVAVTVGILAIEEEPLH